MFSLSDGNDETTTTTKAGEQGAAWVDEGAGGITCVIEFQTQSM